MTNHNQTKIVTVLVAGLACVFAYTASGDPVTGWGLETGIQNATLTEGVAGSFSVTTPTGNAGPRAVLSAPLTFSSVGDVAHLSGTVTVSNIFGNQQVRFGLFNNNGHALGTLGSGLWTGADAAGWLGYIVEPRNAGGSGNTALYGRNGSGANSWLSTSGSAYLLASGSETFSGAYTTAPGTFSFDLILRRLSATDVSVLYSFIETDGIGNFSATGDYTDRGGLSSGMSSFNAVGFLLNANTGGASFVDVEVSVPEPSALALGILGLAGATMLRRRNV